MTIAVNKLGTLITYICLMGFQLVIKRFSDFRSCTNPDSIFRMGCDDCRNMSQMECVIEDPQVAGQGNDWMT